MKKILITEALFLLLLGAVLIITLGKRPVNDVTVREAETVLTEASANVNFEKYDALKLRRDFSLEAPDYEGFLYLGQPDTMEIRTMVLIKCRDEKQTETVVRAFETYIAEQKNAFEGYGASQMKLLNEAEIYEKGPYAALFISEDAREWKSRLKQITEG